MTKCPQLHVNMLCTFRASHLAVCTLNFYVPVHTHSDDSVDSSYCAERRPQAALPVSQLLFVQHCTISVPSTVPLYSTVQSVYPVLYHCTALYSQFTQYCTIVQHCTVSVPSTVPLYSTVQSVYPVLYHCTALYSQCTQYCTIRSYYSHNHLCEQYILICVYNILPFVCAIFCIQYCVLVTRFAVLLLEYGYVVEQMDVLPCTEFVYVHVCNVNITALLFDMNIIVLKLKLLHMS